MQYAKHWTSKRQKNGAHAHTHTHTHTYIYIYVHAYIHPNQYMNVQICNTITELRNTHTQVRTNRPDIIIN